MSRAEDVLHTLRVGDLIQSTRTLRVTDIDDYRQIIHFKDQVSGRSFNSYLDDEDHGSWRVEVLQKAVKGVSDFKVGDVISGDDYKLDWPTGTLVDDERSIAPYVKARTGWVNTYSGETDETAHLRRTIKYLP